MPIKVKLPQQNNKYTGERILKSDPLIPQGVSFFSPIDLADYTRYVDNPVLTGDVQFDLDSLTETRASNQPYSHRLGNSLVKFVGKSAVNTLGGLASIPALIGAAFSGDYATSEIFKGIDEASEWFDEAFPHYLTKAQQNYGLAQKLNPFDKAFYDSGFWGDSVLGGASFLVGTVASEMILSALTAGTGGLAAPLQAAHMSRVAKTLGRLRKPLARAANNATKAGLKADDVIKGLNSEAVRKTWGRIGRLGLSTVTSTFYEAGLEARSFKEHAIQTLTAQFEQQNFRKPNEEELADMQKAVDKGGNAVFALNAVTVGLSNAILLDKLIGGPIGKLADDIKIKKLKDDIVKGADGVYTARTRTKFQRTLDGIYTGIASAGREGLEEGLQKAYETGLNEYLLSEYNLDATDNVGILSNIMNEGLAKAFGTEEGLEEVIVGGLLGLIGVPGLVKGSAQEAIEKFRGKDDYTLFLNKLAQDLTKNKDTGLHNNLKLLLRLKGANDRRNVGISMQDMFDFKNEEAQLTYAYMNAQNKAGKLDEEVTNLTTAIDEMSETEFREKYAVDDSVDVNEAKETIKTALKDSAESFKKSRKLANKFVGANILSSEVEDTVDAISMLAFQTYDLDAREAQIAQNIKELMPEFDIDLQKTLNKLKGGRGGLTAALNNINRKQRVLNNKIKDVNNRIEKLEQASVPGTEEADKNKAELVKLYNEKNKLFTELNELDVERRNEIIETIKQSEKLSEELKETEDAGDYENNFEEYLNKIEKAVTQAAELDKVLKNRSGLEFQKAALEISDLGRIANKRESLIAAYDYMVTSEGQQKFSETNNKFKEALLQKAKYDLIYQAQLERFIEERGLDEYSNYLGALQALNQELDEKYAEKETDDILATKLNVYKVTDKNGNTVFVHLVQYRDGHLELYETNAKGEPLKNGVLNKTFELNRESSIDAYAIAVNYFNRARAAAVNGNFDLRQIKNLARYLNANIEFKDDSVVIGDTEYTFENKELVLDKLEQELLSVATDLNFAQGATSAILQEVSERRGVEFTNVELVSSKTENLQTRKQLEIFLEKRKELSVLQSLLFSKYSKKDLVGTATLVGQSPETALENYTSGESVDKDMSLYQSNYMSMLGKKFLKEKEIEEQKVPELKEKPPGNVPPAPPPNLPPGGSSQLPGELIQGNVKTEGEEKQGGLPGGPIEPQESLGQEEGQPPKRKEGALPGSPLKEPNEVINTGEDVEEDTGEDSGKPPIQLLGGSKKGWNKSNPINQMKQLFINFYSAEQKDAAANAVTQAQRTGNFVYGFEIETINKIYGDSTEENGISTTAGTVRNGKTHFIHVTLNGVRIGRLLDGNRFKDQNGRILDFNNVEDILLFNPEATDKDVQEALLNLQLAQSALSDLLIESGREVIPNAQQFLDAAGVKLNINPFVLLEDYSKVELRELAAKNPNELNVIANYPVNEYGIEINGNKVIPIYDAKTKKAQAVFYIGKDGRTKLLTSIKDSQQDKLKELADKALTRKNLNSSNSFMLINDGQNYRTVNIETPTLSAEVQKKANENAASVLKNNKTIPDEFIVPKANTSLSFVGVESGTDITIKTEDGNTLNGKVAKDSSSLFIKYKTINNKPAVVIQISRELVISTVENGQQKLYKLRAKSIESSVTYSNGNYMLRTPTDKILSSSVFDLQKILTVINDELSDLSSQPFYRLPLEGDLRLEGKKVSTVTPIPIKKLGSLGFIDRSSERGAFIPLMITHQAANKVTPSIPNQAFATLEISKKIDVTNNNPEVTNESTLPEVTENLNVQEQLNRWQKTKAKLEGHVNAPLKKNNPNGDNIELTEPELQIVSAKINKILDTSKTVEEAQNRISNIRIDGQQWGFRSNDRQNFNAFVEARIAKITNETFEEFRAYKPESSTTATKEDYQPSPSDLGDLGFSIDTSVQVASELGVDIDTLLKNGTVKYTDETGTECAKAGMASAKFTAGSKWSLVKDLKNMPTHEQGGVNLTFGDGGFMVGKVKAEKGLIIKFNK